mmetsp:Transcript_21440/g.68323  ORF Transcript_21440/g.68323 Transcript_21440/m.68323 type:complete len:280 (-) Transcript_21440:1529-2368(-)
MASNKRPPYPPQQMNKILFLGTFAIPLLAADGVERFWDCRLESAFEVGVVGVEKLEWPLVWHEKRHLQGSLDEGAHKRVVVEAQLRQRPKRAGVSLHQDGVDVVVIRRRQTERERVPSLSYIAFTIQKWPTSAGVASHELANERDQREDCVRRAKRCQDRQPGHDCGNAIVLKQLPPEKNCFDSADQDRDVLVTVRHRRNQAQHPTVQVGNVLALIHIQLDARSAQSHRHRVHRLKTCLQGHCIAADQIRQNRHERLGNIQVDEVDVTRNALQHDREKL